MNLSLPATALFTELRDTGERYAREAFEREFPGVDYDAALSEALEELKNTGPTETGKSFTYDKPTGVLFTQKNARPIRID